MVRGSSRRAASVVEYVFVLVFLIVAVAAAYRQLGTKAGRAAENAASALGGEGEDGEGSEGTFAGAGDVLASASAVAVLGRDEDDTFGDSARGLLGAARDLVPSVDTLRGVGMGGALFTGRSMTLAAIDRGALVPDPASRLGAYAATRGYPPGTVGYSVHNAIGGIYWGLGAYGEERIGRVFNAPEAQALYGQPVDSAAGRQMAAIEHAYWENVRKEDPLSAGGRLGSAFSPSVRDALQRRVFSWLRF